MAYVALYRKFRPPVWEDVRGQDHIVTTLRNQIRSGRIGHAYLFCGTRGTGKTSVAKIFARAVNCENPQNESPCGTCAVCRAIADGSSLDVIEIDAASNNGVDDVRNIIEEVTYSPTLGKYKVYIIDEVHMMSPSAFNALLKTLEEPPSYVIFILATTEVHKLLVTILSRCQRYDFRRLNVATIGERLREVADAEGIEIEERALQFIARTADGAMRDGLSLLDQCAAFHYGETLTYDRVLSVLGAVDTTIFAAFFEQLYRGDVTEALRRVVDLSAQGRDLTQFVRDFVWYLRNLMLASTSGDLSDVIDISEERMEALRTQAKEVQLTTVMRYIRIFSELANRMHYDTQKRILLEMSIIRVCRPESETREDAFEDRLRVLEERNARLEEALHSGTFVANAGLSGGAPADVEAVPEAPPREIAVPEEIRQLIEDWGNVFPRLPGEVKAQFRLEPKPRLSVSEDGAFVIAVFHKMSAELLREESRIREIEEIFSGAIKKEVPVKVELLTDETAFRGQFIDLTEKIHADIVTEEDTEGFV